MTDDQIKLLGRYLQQGGRAALSIATGEYREVFAVDTVRCVLHIIGRGIIPCKAVDGAQLVTFPIQPLFTTIAAGVAELDDCDAVA